MLIAGNLWDFMWSLLVIFFMVAFFIILFHVAIDLFSRHDISGWSKALWLGFMIFLPFLGIFAYLITNSRSMAERQAAQATAAQSDFDSYVQSVAGSGGAAAEIEKAKGLLDSGAITQQEFEAMKAKALAS